MNLLFPMTCFQPSIILPQTAKLPLLPNYLLQQSMLFVVCVRPPAVCTGGPRAHDGSVALTPLVWGLW